MTTGPYTAEFGAITHEGTRGHLFTVNPPRYAVGVAEALNSSEWQTIDTAPLGNDTDGPFIDVAWSNPDPELRVRQTDCYRDGDTIKRKEWRGHHAVWKVFRPQPTHWRPAPELPA